MVLCCLWYIYGVWFGLIDIGCFGVVVVLVDNCLLLHGLDVCC